MTHVSGFQLHLPAGRIDRGPLEAIADVWTADEAGGPAWDAPLAADEAVGDQLAALHVPADDVNAHHGRVHRVRVLAPGCLRHRLPRVAAEEGECAERLEKTLQNDSVRRGRALLVRGFGLVRQLVQHSMEIAAA